MMEIYQSQLRGKGEFLLRVHSIFSFYQVKRTKLSKEYNLLCTIQSVHVSFSSNALNYKVNRHKIAKMFVLMIVCCKIKLNLG